MRRRLLLVPALALVSPAALPGGTAAAGGGCLVSPVTDGSAAVVQIEHACFVPMVTRVAPRSVVRWVNASGLPHNLTGPGGIDYSELPVGRTVTFRVGGSGVYPYACTLHPGMSGAIVAGDGVASQSTAGLLLPGREGDAAMAEQDSKAATGAGGAAGGSGGSGSGSAAGSAGGSADGGAAPALDPVASSSDGGSPAGWLGALLAVGVAAAAVLRGVRRHPAAA